MDSSTHGEGKNLHMGRIKWTECLAELDIENLLRRILSDILDLQGSSLEKE